MKSLIRVVVSVVCSAVPASTYAVTNGSFEDLDASYVNLAGSDKMLGAAATGWDTFGSTSPDWVLSDGPEDLYFTPTGSHFAVGAATGTTGSAYREGVSQSVSGFTIGEQYEISFSHANGLWYDDNIDSYLGLGEAGGWQVILDGGTSIDFVASSNDNSTSSLLFTSAWESSEVIFTATAETHEILFLAYKPDGPQDPTFQFLDNVAVQQVPEPASLWIVGLAGVLMMRRR